MRISPEEDEHHLLVDGVDFVHVLLNFLGFAGFLYDICCDSCVNRLCQNKLLEILHSIQNVRCLYLITIKLSEFLANSFFKDLLVSLVDDWASLVFFEVL